MGLTKNEIIKLEKQRLSSKIFRVELLNGEFSSLSVFTMSRFETMPNKLSPISKITKSVHSKLSLSIFLSLLSSNRPKYWYWNSSNFGFVIEEFSTFFKWPTHHSCFVKAEFSFFHLWWPERKNKKVVNIMVLIWHFRHNRILAWKKFFSASRFCYTYYLLQRVQFPKILIWFVQTL